MRSLSFFIFRCICTLWFLNLVAAQLTGSITSPGNPFIITVKITNPTTDTLSLLKWNNIFDNETQLPVSFNIKDDVGNDLQIASTYAMRSGMTSSDLYVFTPQQTFVQIFDLRTYLQDLPNGRDGLQTRVIQISLPTVFPGVAQHEVYSVPSEAATHLSEQPSTLGNFSAAGLEKITVDAAPLRLAFQFPIFQQLSGNEIGPADGIQPDKAQCTFPNMTGVPDALADTELYAHSVQLAASDPNSMLYQSYFPDSLRNTVQSIATSVVNSTRGHGPHVDLYCSDILNLCGSNSNILGYTFTPSWIGSAYIVLCPSALNLGRAPAPCSTPAGTQTSASTSHVLFHLMLTVNNVVGRVISNSVYGSLASQKLLEASKAGQPTTDPLGNVDSYAQLAVAQWEYGLGGPPYTGEACLPPDNKLHQNDKRIVSVQADGLDEPTTRDRRLSIRQDATEQYYLDMAERAEECKGTQEIVIQNAAENARALARAARDNKDDELWKQAFNGDATVKAQVKKIFNIIAHWNTTSNPAGVNFRCDPRRRSAACSHGSTAAALKFPRLHKAYLIFCPQFFYNPPLLPCSSPSTSTPYIADQAGSILHELLHVRWLVQTVISDGFHADFGQGACYGWNCVTQYARDRVLPGHDDPRNFGEHVASAYEYYAYAARAAEANCTGAGRGDWWSGWAGSLFGLNH